MNDLGYSIIGTIICFIIGYFVGSINWSIILSKKIYNTDVREYSSKNAGATNTYRVLGPKIGVLVFFLDVSKVPFTIIMSFLFSLITTKTYALFGGISYYIPAFGVIIGHCWPIWFKFKGGKAVSTFIGLTICINIFYFLIFAFVWWSLYFIFKKVSFSSIIATIVIVLFCWLPWISGFDQMPSFWLDLNNINWELNFSNFHQYSFALNYSQTCLDSWYISNIILLLSGIILICKHHKNINRLLDGEEKKFYFSKTDGDLEVKNCKNDNKTEEPINENVVKKIKKRLLKNNLFLILINEISII
ncbi:glycerol-3-phosphate 1-O-acyltransferase PlsY [Spiroplasma endosymbiont of Amphibalanus improvisus]|uniref:glycerol-3-phosphate 1-O-acyltransferase PlsY n=1 Tax=Spiroplasma endosymbiont of Amphibalanus improvisus TaxID=3066327 RepID=UPI00313BD505